MNKALYILVVNAGSSSLKLSLFCDSSETKAKEAIWKASIDGRADNAKVKISAKQKTTELTINASNDDELLKIFQTLWKGSQAVVEEPSQIAMVGHRVVHGGTKYSASVVVDDNVIFELTKLIELAPEHEGANIHAIQLAQKFLPQAKHVAVFDTAFHHEMPLASQVYPVPYEWYTNFGIRRYGFHGINHSYCTQRALTLLKPGSAGRVISCHLGSGASLCASKSGKSQLTSMGFTPLEGLVMRTRSGSLDPGILLHLMHEHKFSSEELNKILNEKSGLRGISGLSGDMREIESELAKGNSRAQLAFDIFEQVLASTISGFAAVLGGVDAIVFTGGIGENSSLVRETTSNRLAFIGVELDKDLNQAKFEDAAIISKESSKVTVMVIPAREDLAVADECRAKMQCE